MEVKQDTIGNRIRKLIEEWVAVVEEIETPLGMTDNEKQERIRSSLEQMQSFWQKRVVGFYIDIDEVLSKYQNK